MATTLINSPLTHLPLELNCNKNRKNAIIRYHPIKRVFVLNHPASYSQRKIEKLIEKHAVSMQRYLEALPPAITLTYGSVIPILGQPHRITAHSEAQDPTFSNLIIPATRRTCKPLLVATLRNILKIHIETHIQHLLQQPPLNTLDTLPSFCLRDPISRWGSCSSDGKLMFSWRLVFAPVNVVEYVVAHECAHLLHHNHSDAFWKATHALHPDISVAKAWLKRYHLVLFSYQ